MEDKEIFASVEKNIDALVDANVWWAQPVNRQKLVDAKNGKIDLCLGNKTPPREWLPSDLSACSILCLAGAGGQQAPILAMAGAKVTVLDLSEKMLEKDRIVSEQEGLDIRIEHGNMCDLSRFSDNSFDVIINPPSLMYVPSLKGVFMECYRVLKKSGVIIIAAPTPIDFICDYIESENCYRVANKMPYRSYEHDEQGDWIEFGHSMEDYLGGLLGAGFVISGYYEDIGNDTNNKDELGAYCATGFVAKATKL